MAVGVILAAFCGAWVFALGRVQRACIMEEVREGGLRLAETIRRSLRYAMLHDDRAAIEEMVHSMGENDDLSAIRIVAKTGRVMYSSRLQDRGRQIPLEDAACRGCHFRGTPATTVDPSERARVFERADGVRVFQLMEPIRNERGCSSAACHVHPASQRILGILELEMSLDRVEAGIAKAQARLLGLSAVLVLAVSAVVFWLVHRLVARRVALLVEGTQRVAAGDLDYRISTGGRDEIGRLAQSFNTMARNLSEAREHMLHADRLAALGRLAAGVAHELNNPLTAVMMFASSLAAERPQDDKAQAALRVILDETERCRQIIRGLLDFARQREPTKTAARVEEVVDRAVQVVAGQASRLGVVIERQPPLSDLPEVEMDPAQIQQVLVNLLANALDATVEARGDRGGPGRVIVSWRLADNGMVEVEVRDEGTGIPPEHRARIFEPFFTTKGRKGTGLGLSIAWGIMEQHRGGVRVSSEPGRGSAFTLWLPLKSPRVDGVRRVETSGGRDGHEDSGR